MTFELRPMTIEDLGQVMEIEREAFREPWPRQSFEQELLVLDASELTVAVSDNVVLGYTVAWYLDEDVHLANVAVRRGFRERGIGRALVESVIDRAISVGAERIVLEVRRSNVEAKKLYETLGFLVTGVRKNYYRAEKEDAILMTCRLPDVRDGRGRRRG